MEVNKYLLLRTKVEGEIVLKQLEEANARQETLTPETNAVNAFRTSLFSEFGNIVLSRAMCTRSEGEQSAMFHIPESSLCHAIETVGKKLTEWHSRELHLIANVAESLIRTYQRQALSYESQLVHEKHCRVIEAKAMERRGQAYIADRKYALLFANGALAKQAEALREQLSTAEKTMREEVRVEYQERLTKLQSEVMLSEQRFQSYKKKTFRDMQLALEEIKRGAMLGVGKMENAPLHMKRQALRIAISEDELNTLKEQNSELKQAITKVKLWYEIKAMRMKASFEKRLQEASSAAEASKASYWDSKETTEREIKELRQQLSSTQYQLSQSEIEMELLRRDLQLQLSNKKDLVSWKVQNAKMVEDLQKKLKRFERWSHLDLDKIVADYEKRQAAQTSERGESPQRSGGQGATGNMRAASGDGQMVSMEEHRRVVEKLDREKRLKEQAFAKIDELRQADAGTNEAMVWQRKYFEAASELQRCIKELEATRAHLVAHQVPLPGTPSGAANPLSAFNRASPSPMSKGSPSNGGPSFELRPSTQSAPTRPPVSKMPQGHRVVSSASTVVSRPEKP
jgi:hypothetical protein